MAYVALISALFAFLLVWFLSPWFIRYLKRIGIAVKDMNKKGKPLVPLSGGLLVLAGLLFGVFLFVFLKVFFSLGDSLFLLDYRNLSFLLASLLTITIVTFIGFLDDVVILSNKRESAGFKQWQRPLLTLIAAVPLMAVNVGTTKMIVPFIGTVDFGIIYPLVLIPIGVVGASNMVNMFAGFNGLEAGMGIVYIGMLGLYAFIYDKFIVALIALIVVACLLALIRYNWCPAKILAGDSLTYLLGSTIAVIAIVGNMEKAALIIAIPFIFEFFLKLRKKFKVRSYGYYYKGKVKSYYSKIYSIPHFFTIKGKFTEKQVVWFCILISFVFSLLIWVV